MTTVATIRRNVLRAVIPPPRLHLSEWIEQNIRLPEGEPPQGYSARRHPQQT